MTLVRYIWPLWAWLAFQFGWNMLLMVPTHGDNSALGNWVYGRNCNWGWCDGNLVVLIIGVIFGVLLIANAIYQVTR